MPVGKRTTEGEVEIFNDTILGSIMQGVILLISVLELAPPLCVSTTFGCCWDKSTPASAPIGSGSEKCPGKHLL